MYIFYASQVTKFRHKILGSWDATHYNAIEARKSSKMRLELTKGSYRNINQFYSSKHKHLDLVS